MVKPKGAATEDTLTFVENIVNLGARDHRDRLLGAGDSASTQWRGGRAGWRGWTASVGTRWLIPPLVVSKELEHPMAEVDLRELIG